MKLKDSELLWAMDALTQQGHPDPEGLVARIEQAPEDEGNIAGVDPQEAAQYGIPFVDEPAMSLFAAAKRDITTGDVSQYQTIDRMPLRKRTEAALLQGTQPKHPFLDPQGRLTVHRGKTAKPTKAPSDTTLRTEILALMDDYS